MYSQTISRLLNLYWRLTTVMGDVKATKDIGMNQQAKWHDASVVLENLRRCICILDVTMVPYI